MISVAVIGANGYVGRAICDALYLNNSNPNRKETYGVFEVTRENYESRRRERLTNPPTAYNTIINCAMPSNRFWVNNNEILDRIETVDKTRELIESWDYNKFIQISTVSARCEANTVYGRHKLEAESLCPSNSLIVRLTAMYSDNLKRGALLNILNNERVYVARDSRYAFTSLDVVGKWIADNMDRSGLVEFGARNTISLGEIAKHIGSYSFFEGELQNQYVVNPDSDFPDAYDVLKFMEQTCKV